MTKQVTKSIRLTPDEARDLANLVEESDASESALMRRWVLRGMREYRIERAVAAYQRDEVDLREGAAMAAIPIGVFVDELAARRVALLHDPELIMAEVEDFRAAFGQTDRESVAATGKRSKRRSA